MSYRADAERVLTAIIRGILDRDLHPDTLPAFLRETEVEKELSNLRGRFSYAFWDDKTSSVVKRSVDDTDLDLDSLPILPRHLLDESGRYDYDIFDNRIVGSARKTAQVITTRGCVHRCVFCSSVGKSARRNVWKVLEELERLVKEEKYEAVFFDDSSFGDECGEARAMHRLNCPYTSDKEHVGICPKYASREELEKHGMLDEKGKCGYAMKLCKEIINRNLVFVWGCQTRADVIHKRLLELMRKAGCTYVYFGVESMNKNVLDKMCKDIGPQRTANGISLAREEGLDVGLSLVFGLEGENLATVQETIREVAQIMKPPKQSDSRIPCVSINIATVYPGTQLEKRLRELGAELPDFDKPPKLIGYPWNEFEDGVWNLCPCYALAGKTVSESEAREFVETALEECRSKFERALI